MSSSTSLVGLTKVNVLTRQVGPTGCGPAPGGADTGMGCWLDIGQFYYNGDRRDRM